VKGALAAGILFVLRGAAVKPALLVICATLGDVPIISAAFYGLKCAVVAGLDGAVAGRAGRGVSIPAETCRVEDARITAAAGLVPRLVAGA
jgi:chromate transport protein ChrA